MKDDKKKVVLVAGLLTGVALTAIAVMNTPKKRDQRFTKRHREDTHRQCRSGGAC